MVTIDRVFTDMKMDSIVVDNRDASYHVVKRMIAGGARRIACLTTNPHLYTMNERRMGYEDALREAGIETTKALVGAAAFDNYSEEMYHVLDGIYRDVPNVDGFFFTTHILAIEAFRYFYERGINANGNYQLGCIHGIPAFKALAPDIIVARMPVEDIGGNAVRIVTEKIACSRKGEKHPFERLVLKCTYPTDLNELSRKATDG